MTRYLLCELDGEHYTQPSFEWHDSLDKAKAAAGKMLQDCWNMEDPELKWEDRDGSWWADMKVPDEVTEFEVFQIFAVDTDNGNHLCVWYHAYDGVDFKILYQDKGEENVALFLHDDAASVNGEHDGDDWHMVVDTGNEWEVWNYVEVE